MLLYSNILQFYITLLSVLFISFPYFFQTANARLQDQLYAAQEKLRQQKETSVDPEALRRRLEEVTKAIKASKVNQVFKVR